MKFLRTVVRAQESVHVNLTTCLILRRTFLIFFRFCYNQLALSMVVGEEGGERVDVVRQRWVVFCKGIEVLESSCTGPTDSIRRCRCSRHSVFDNEIISCGSALSILEHKSCRSLSSFATSIKILRMWLMDETVFSGAPAASANDSTCPTNSESISVLELRWYILSW